MLTCVIGHCDLFGFLASLAIVGGGSCSRATRASRDMLTVCSGGVLRHKCWLLCSVQRREELKFGQILEYRRRSLCWRLAYLHLYEWPSKHGGDSHYYLAI